MAGICPLLGFLVLQGESSNTLAFWKYIEGSATFLRVPYWFFAFNVFGGGSEFVLRTWLRFPRKMALRFWPNPLDVLVSCFQVLQIFNRAVCAAVLWYYCIFCSLCKGYLNFLEVLLCDCKQCIWKSSPRLPFSLYLDKEGIKGLTSLLSDNISCVATIALIFYRRR